MPDFSTSNSGYLVGYQPAQLCEGKEWFVYFYARTPETPITGKLKRCRIKINRIKDKRQRRKYANVLIDRINADLRDGWSPFLEDRSGNPALILHECFDIYEKKKLKQLEYDTVRSYRSQIRMLVQWLRATKRIDIRAIDFSRKNALEYLEWALETKKIAPRTYNNYIRCCGAIFSWLVDREYIGKNPFEKIPKLRVPKKNRVPIPADIRKDIIGYFKKEWPPMVLCCYLMFYTELRPTEQTKLRVKDFDLDRQIIRINPSQSKTHQSRFPTIPGVFVRELRRLNWESFNPNHYFISDNWEPGPSKLEPREIAKKWDKMREALELPVKYKFYSLRDSGIEWMLEQNVTPHDVMKQSGHTSLATTDLYANHRSPVANERLKNIPDGF